MTLIEDLLRTRTGIDAAAVGRAGIHRAVHARMRSLGIQSLPEYRALIERVPARWHELVEAVVVTESWFLREPRTIGSFVRLVIDEWLPAHPGSNLRVLSIPCAAGEEPYSLAMALLDAGMSPTRIQIRGVDISSQALARAEKGVYGMNSFRGQNLAYRRRYFQRVGSNRFSVSAPVRSCVSFSQGNLVDQRLLSGSLPFDFLFCRNVLIYFDRLTQRRVLDRVERLLEPEGLLFVGPAEQTVVLESRFVRAGSPSAFVCRKGSRRTGASQCKAEPAAKSSVACDSLRNEPSDANCSAVLLETARRLSGQGQLQEAAELCEAYLRHTRDSADAYFLLGQVREASGDKSAMDCYRKALYLQPDHFGSLTQLALLLNRNGDSARARTFESRAERLQAVRQTA